MKSVKTRGIVIKRMELGEADRLLTIFTYDLGKVRALAKGSRKPLSKMAGHLEPFSATSLELHEGRTFYVITGAQLQDAYSSIRDNLTKTSLACYFLEMTDALTPDAQTQSTVFELLEESLSILESSFRSEDSHLLTTAFTLKLLADLGFLPELTHCVSCHAPLGQEGNVFSPQLGGVLGPECAKTDFDVLPVSANTIKAMRLFLIEPMNVVWRIKPSRLVLDELEEITQRYLHYHAGRTLYSSNFVKDARDE